MAESASHGNGVKLDERRELIFAPQVFHFEGIACNFSKDPRL
jgi:hypothetical protein